MSNNNNNGSEPEFNLTGALANAIVNNDLARVDKIVEENNELPYIFSDMLRDISTIEMLDLLIFHGLPLIVEDESLLADFIRDGKRELALYLLTKDINVDSFSNFNGKTAFMEATMNQDTDMMHRLLEAGANMNLAVKELPPPYNSIVNRQRVGDTALHLASCLTPELVQWLLTRGARTDIQNRLGFFPIHAATMCNKLDIIQVFLDNGVPVDIRGISNYTPLSKASDIRTIDFLLEHGADINGTFGPNSDTLLTKAAYDDDPDRIRYLMRKRGIDTYVKRLDYPNWPGHGGRTALEIALQSRNHRAVEILVALAPESARPVYFTFMSAGMTGNRIAEVAGANAANRRKPALLSRLSYQNAQRKATDAFYRAQGAVGGGAGEGVAVPVSVPAGGAGAGVAVTTPTANSTSGKANSALRKTRRKRRLSRKQRKKGKNTK